MLFARGEIMHTKNITKCIRIQEVCTVAIWWGVVMLIGWGVLFATKASTHITEVLLTGFLVLVLLLALTLLDAKRKSRRICQKLQEEIDAFDEETFQKIDRLYSVSKNCLVYHSGVKFIGIAKENIISVHFDGNKILVSMRNKDGVYMLPCSLETNAYIQQWLQ